MQKDSRLPEKWFQDAGSIVVVEASGGAPRESWVRARLEEAEQGGAAVWWLPSSFHDAGPWAGVERLFGSLIDEMRATRPDLVQRHDYELVYVLPELKRVLSVRNPSLTDLAPPEERVRNYPADRAFRIVHGLIDLLDAWKGNDERCWVLACDPFDEAGSIGRRFFRELMRRRGLRMRLVLLASVAPGQGEATLKEFASARSCRRVWLDLPEEAPPAAYLEQMARRGAELESLVGADSLEMQIHLAELVGIWRRVGDYRRLYEWSYRALELYNTLGLYEDARVYGAEAIAAFLAFPHQNQDQRWQIFVKQFMSHLGLLDAVAAHDFAQSFVVRQIDSHEQNAQLCYLLAMLYARYLPERDLARGEAYLQLGLEYLDQCAFDPQHYHFQYVFNRNGLAMIRNFQGRHAEAIELCRLGSERLDEHLGKEQHRLHRSVLLYNLAQVHSALGSLDQALAGYTAAMVLDPNYSEYYNERGSLYLRAGRFEEALADYFRAIELSPPYHEVYTNLGQCQRLYGFPKLAIEAYSVALDLEPGQALARVGRAQCYEHLGRTDEALADYDIALASRSDQWEALANRAALRYERGDLAGAVADLDLAIELKPDEADLLQNRSMPLLDLARYEEAARDLEAYLALRPDAEDRGHVEEKLQSCLTNTGIAFLPQKLPRSTIPSVS